MLAVATLHVYVVPVAVLLSTILGAVPLHTAGVDGVAVIDGIGLTVIVAVMLAEQVLAVPVIVYVAVAEVLLLLLVNVCEIGDPVPLLLPPSVMPLAVATLHAYVVPSTLLLRAILGALPLQIATVAGVAVTTGIGLTVTVTADVVAVQLPEVVCR